MAYGFRPDVQLADRRFVYDAAAARRLRTCPCVRVTEARRPATEEDGFTAAEIASGCVIVTRHRGPWPEAQARADEIVTA